MSNTAWPAANKAVLSETHELLAPLACRTGPPNDTPVPLIELTVARRRFFALLDTGASASLFGDEVYDHLCRNAIRLRSSNVTFRLASGSAQASAAARLVVRWEKRVRRRRLAYLPGLSVPIILGRDFLAETGIVIDVCNGGYRERACGTLKPFVSFQKASETITFDDASRADRPNNCPKKSLVHGSAGSTNRPAEKERAGGNGSPRARPPTPSAEALCTAERGERDHPLLNSSSSLTVEEKARLSSLLNEYDAIFTEQPGCTALVRHKIETGDASPWKCNPRPVSLAKRKALDSALDELLDTGVVERSESPWGFPVVLVPKKDGTTRLCVDYRRLNEVARKDAYPLPSIPSIVSNVGGAKYFTTLDASRGYFQVEVDPRDREKTAFTCHRGLFQFTRMPFGLVGAPATYQRLMDRVLGDARWHYALAYLDDVVVYSRTFDEHLRHLRDVLERLRSAGITLNPAKTQIAETRVTLLGFTLDNGRLLPCDDKVQALLNYPSPTDIGGLRSFLGLVNFYRQFIPDCAALQAPLTLLLRKGERWRWGPEQEEALRNLIKALAETTELRLADLSKDFVIQTDASDLGLGAVLLQQHEGGLRPVAFASRSLTPAEKNYSVTEKECLAIIFARKKFDYYILMEFNLLSRLITWH